MSHNQKQIEDIGRIMVKGAPRDLDSERMVQLRQRVINSNRRDSRTRSHRHLWAYGVAAASFAVFVMIGVWLYSSPRPLDVAVDGKTVSETTGMWHRADKDAVLPIHFEDRGMVELRPGAKMSIAQATTKTVSLELAGGTMDVDVNPDGNTNWAVHAGPYTIRVEGTVFLVAWDAVHSKLDVAVSRGQVFVSNLTTPGDGVFVDAGSGIKADWPQKRFMVYSMDTPGDNSDNSNGGSAKDNDIPSKSGSLNNIEAGPEAPLSRDAGPRDPSVAKIASRRSGHGPKRVGNTAITLPETLCNQGDYSGAVEAAHAVGLEKLGERLDASALWKLANASRYVRQPKDALFFLDTIRRRFPTYARAHSSAYIKGKIYADFLKDWNNAHRWFDIYLKENPSGPLADEALGRQMEICLILDRPKDAVRYARRYLKTYKGGLFAKKAEALILQKGTE